MAAVELHLNATYYAQHPALKSVHEKSQSLLVDKLFSSYRGVFELIQSLRDSKTSDLNCSYEAFVEKEALAICHGMFASFLCVLSLLSVFGRFIHLYYPVNCMYKYETFLGNPSLFYGLNIYGSLTQSCWLSVLRNQSSSSCRQWPIPSFSNKVQYHAISFITFWSSVLIFITLFT